MTEPTRHRTAHTQVVQAPPDVLFDLVADVARWPVIFGPSLHAEVLEDDGHQQRFRLWALVNDEVATWTSRRTLDRPGRRIVFEQERSSPPVASMGGEWRVEARSGGVSELVLTHRFSAVDDAPDALDWITTAVDRNSHDELEALRRLAELGPTPAGLVLDFEDVVPLDCTPAAAYDFVAAADLWPERLPHVGRVALHSPRPDVQDLEMDTVTPDGHTHTTRSIRLLFPGERIVYKQLVPPALLLGHSGSWSFGPGADGDSDVDGGGTVVVSRHVVAIDPSAIPGVLGAGTTLADARRHVHDALSANSRATLRHAAAFTAGERVT